MADKEYFEDYEVGQKAISPARTITEADIHTFAGLTGDWHPLHWAKFAGALEGVLGVFIMALFTVSFARKLLR